MEENIKFNLKRLRRKLHLTQEEVGKRIGVGRTMIVHYEQGNYIPTPDKLEIFADIFGVTVNELTAPVEQPPVLPGTNGEAKAEEIKFLRGLTEKQQDQNTLLTKIIERLTDKDN